jgi:hypothetical protein
MYINSDLRGLLLVALIFRFLLQYPVSEHGFEFQQLLVETLYGVSVWDRLQCLVNLLKMISEQNARPAPATAKKRR